MSDITHDKKQSDYRRKRVNRIKRIIVTTIILLILIPTLLSVFLMFRVSSLESKLNHLLTEANIEEFSEGDAAVAKAESKKTTAAAITVTSKAVSTKQTESPKETEPSEEKKVYLTFDDGPSQRTKEILNILKKEDVKASFFVVGHQDKFSKSLYKRMVKEGHTLGMHSYSHIYSEIYSSKDAFSKDFDKLYNYLYKVTKVKPKYYRFPGGSSYTKGAVPMQELIDYLESKQVSYLDWNVVNGDSAGGKLTKSQIVDKVMSGVSQFETSVVQMHDSSDKKETVNALRSLIRKLKKNGYEILPIDDTMTLIRHAQ